MKVRIRSILYFLFLAPAFLPAYLADNRNVQSIANAILLLGFIWFGYRIFINIRKHNRIGINGWMVVVFFLIVIAVTMIRGGDRSVFIYALQAIVPCVLYTTSQESEKIKILRALLIIHALLIICNFGSVILYPTGMSFSGIFKENYYFLGHKNSAIKFMYPGIAYSVFYDISVHKKVHMVSYILTAITLISSILANSGTAIVGMAIISFYLFFISRRDKLDKLIGKYLNAKNVIIGFAILFLLVVVFDNVSFLNGFVNALGRDLTFTGRTLIWNQALVNIAKEPIIGYGYMTTLEGFVYLGSYAPSGAHNLILDILLRGGILLLTVFIVLIVECIKKVDSYSSRYTRFPAWFLLSYVIMWEFEVYINSGYVDLFIILVILSSGIPIYEQSRRNTDGKNTEHSVAAG